MTEPVQHLAGDINRQVSNVLDGSDVIDLLNRAAAPIMFAAHSVNDIVAGPPGVSGEITDTVAATVGDIAHAVGQIADIPTSILSGYHAKGDS
ncbi:hypothetical protein [Ochrobactrum sp. MYb379]|uniref:hypothetical protein n=1 Tax=Ochrobactrum sp. MYb379 TaxID=2745275 RepID=UPI0030A07F59